MNQKLHLPMPLLSFFRPALKIFTFICLLLFASASFATDYYCDPVSGSMLNDGSAASPWSTLEEVFTAGKTFFPGDNIYLRSGHHGSPRVTGMNAGNVTIQPESGHTPTLRKLRVVDGKNWVIQGLVISPETAGIFERDVYVAFGTTSSYITLRQCRIYSTSSDLSGWTATDVVNRFGGGIWLGATHCTLSENLFTQIKHGIEVTKSAKHTLVTSNRVEGFSGDAIRGLSDSSVYEYNLIKNAYKVDGNHDDGFQSWTTDASGKVGKGVLKDVVLRGNLIIAQTDRNQPFPGSTLQGIGCFDGFYENWTVENNVVITDMWHGISFYGATNCKIINNTVVKNPLNIVAAPIPWIGIYDHKDRRLSKGNLMYNNLASSYSNLLGVTLRSNIKTSSYNFHFVDYGTFDLHLKARSSAVNAGTTQNASSIDLDKYPRTIPYDIGAFEYRAEADTTVNEYPGTPDDVIYDDSVAVFGKNHWRSFFVSEQSRGFTAEFDAVPNKNNMDGVTGILKGFASLFTHLACIARFNTSGQIDVMKGTGYSADTVVSYSAGTKYHFRFEINVITKTYSVYVTPEGQDEVLLASQYPFRASQANVDLLDSWALYSVSGSHTVSNMKFTADTIPPIVLTKNITVLLDSTGNASITPDQVDNGSNDNVQISSYQLDKTAFDCSNLGENQVTLTVTDYNDNSASATAVVTVADAIAPIVLTRNITVTLANGTASITADQVDNGSTDNCVIDSMSVSPSSFSCSDLGEQKVMLTVTDSQGNSSQDSAIVTVIGVIPEPILTISRTDTTFTGLEENTIALGYGAQQLKLTVENSSSAPESSTYLWSPADHLSNTTGSSTVFSPTAAGTYVYTVTATNEYGCTASKEAVLQVIDSRCGKNNDKVLMLHYTDSAEHSQIICVSANAVPDLLAEGSKLQDKGSSTTSENSTAISRQNNFALIQKDVIQKSAGQKISLSVYPNPIHDRSTITFSVPYSGNVILEIVSLDGRVKKLFERNIQGSQVYTVSLDGAAILPGMYFIRVVTPKHTAHFKMIKN